MPDTIGIRRLPAPDILVAPSLLAADFAALATQIAEVTDAGADLLHVDIMDGHFVPNLSMGPGIVKSIRPHTELLLDTHLMVSHPAAYAEPFIKAGADHITFHVEAEDDIADTIALIRDLGVTAGLCVKPATPADVLEPFLDDIDLILVMTVEPGFGGQSFMGDMMPKIRTIRQMIDHADHPIHLEVDGGITPDTAQTVKDAGANMLVAGTSIFRAAEGMSAAIDGILATADT